MIFSVHGSAWYVCLSILPWKPRPVHNSFNAADFKPRGQPWRTFLVSNCLCFSCLSHPCLILTNFDCHVYFRKTVVRKSIFLSFIFLECADTSRDDLELEMWVETSTQSSHNASKHIRQNYGRWKSWATGLLTNSSAYMNLRLESEFSSSRSQFFTILADPKPVNNVLSSLQVGLFTQLCHWIGLNAF